MARHFQFWDKPARARVAEFDHDLLRDETPYPFVVQTEQHKLARMGIDRLKSFADTPPTHTQHRVRAGANDYQ